MFFLKPYFFRKKGDCIKHEKHPVVSGYEGKDIGRAAMWVVIKFSTKASRYSRYRWKLCMKTDCKAGMEYLNISECQSWYESRSVIREFLSNENIAHHKRYLLTISGTRKRCTMPGGLLRRNKVLVPSQSFFKKR